MAYNFTPFKDKLKSTEEWLRREYSTIRTGQTTPAILDGIKVESYGTLMPLNQVANIGIEDAKSLRVNPWDASMVKDIEKAITVANLGVSVGSDDKGVRVTFPQLTAERRTMIIKIAKEKLEEARIAVRKERERVMKDVDGQEEEGLLGEDEAKKVRNDVQKFVDEANKKLEDLKNLKEKEIAQ